MKKTLAIILAVVMLLGLVPMSAFAVKANNGPADVAWAYIQFFDATGQGTAQATGYVYENKTVKNNAVSGATYDKSSNTLTISNYFHPDVGLSVNMMGDDFKMKVVGECALAGIYVYGDEWGGSLTITGTGKLTVNEGKHSGTAISLLAEGTASVLTVDSGVTVKLFSNEEDSDSGVFSSFYNYVDSADDVVVAKNGQDIFEITGEKYFIENTKYVTANIIDNSESTRNGGCVTTKADDPDGIYGTDIWTRGDGSPEYHVKKYIHSDALGVDFEDPAFIEEYGTSWGEAEFTQEEFEAMGFSMNVTGQTTVHAFCFSGSNNITGFKLINANDPDGLYMIQTDDSYSYSYNDYYDYSNYTFYGIIYRLTLNEYGSTELDDSFTPIEVGTDENSAALPSGYSLALTNEYEEFTVKGTLSQVSGNLYTDASDNEYVVYNLWDSSGDHHYVYALTEVSDIPGVYLGEYRDDIDYTTLTEYAELEETDMFNYFTTVKEFTFSGNGQASSGFPDVPSNAWFYEPAAYCSSRGWITGYGNGNFGPADSLKRQDFVVILARIAGADVSGYTSCKLTDVVMNSYYGKAVAWAVDQGIIGGYQNGKFGVGDKITREQICVILYRYMGSPAVTGAAETLKPFADANKISAFAKDAVVWAIQKGVISGKKPDTLAPTVTASRAEIATIVMRMDKAGMFA